MKIVSLETFHVKPRWMFLKITTDEGITGWGEPVLEGHARSVEAVIKEMEYMLLGEDPMRIEHLWQKMYRCGFYRGGPIMLSAISGIEQALWDIKGKYYHMPVYEMLGGKCREKIKMYTHIKPGAIKGGNTVDEMLDMARDRLKKGYKALKYSIIAPIEPIDNKKALDIHIDRFARVRELIGDEINLAIDFHGRVSPAMAGRLIDALAPYYPFFIEEPCLPENVDCMVKIASQTTVPIAAGERLMGKWAYRELLEKQAVKIVQPDLCHVGGIFEARKIAAMAELYFATVAPHNPLGPISLASCLQLDACIPNFLVQEHLGMPDGADLGVGYIKTPFEIKDGYIEISSKPGLGIEVDEEMLKEKIYDGSWETPILNFEDGSIADW